MPYHVFRHLSAITAVRPKPKWDLRGRKGCEGAAEKGGWEGEVAIGHTGRMEGGREREGRGRGSRRKVYLRVELIKCIDPNEGEAL